MTRAQQTLSVGLLVTALYLACLYGAIPIFGKTIQNEVLPVLPLWSLVTLGAYLLAQIGYNLLTFNDVPQAYERLMKEIETARADLRTKGVDVD